MLGAHPTSPQPMTAGAALAVFGQHYEGLVRFLRRRTGCSDAAHELAHETWLRLVVRADANSAQDSPCSTAQPILAGRWPEEPGAAAQHDSARAYIYAVGARLALNRLRDQGRQQQWIEVAGHEDTEQPCHWPQTHANPARAHELRQALAAIDQHLGQLGQRQRQVLLAHRLDGLPQAELAQQHGVSIKTIERDIAAGMAAIEAALYQWRGEAPATLTAPKASGATATAPQPTMSTARRHGGRRQALSALLGLGAMGGLALLLRPWMLRQGGLGAPQWTLALDSGIGQLQRQDLPDGSQLTLDAASHVVLRYFSTERQAQLHRGSAFFAVAPDAQRPFTVHTTLAHITVLGTRFGVEWQGTPQSPQLRIAVQSGQVRVQPLPGAPDQPRPAPLLLGAGQQVMIDAHGQAHHTQLERPEDAAAWQHGWLLFDGEPLAAAAQRLARYHHAPIRVAPGAAALPVLGRVRIAMAYEWLRLLPQSLPVRVQRASDGGIDILPAPQG